MALPKAIQRQLDEAAAIQQSFQEAVNTDQTLVTDASQLTVPADPPKIETPQPEIPAPAPAPVPATDWEQKFKTLQGKYNAEVQRTQQQVVDSRSQLAEMAREIAALKAKVTETPKKEEPKPITADERDINDFGADMVGMVQKYVQQAYQAMIGQFSAKATELEARINALEQNVNGVSAKAESTLEQQFFATLTQLVPEWEQINGDERWLAWLAEVDPIYGAPRQAALDAAQQRWDVQRTANVFKAFKASLPAKPVETLAQQVAPSGAASPAPAAQPAKQVLSQKFVESFYNDVIRGRYRGREDERQRIEAEINLAGAEGRIR